MIDRLKNNLRMVFRTDSNIIDERNKDSEVEPTISTEYTEDTSKTKNLKEAYSPNTSRSKHSYDESEELVKVLPSLREEGLYGLLGSAAKTLCSGFRAQPELVMLSLMIRICSSIPKGQVVFRNGAMITELRMNGISIMQTGGGKGISEGRADLFISHAKNYTKKGTTELDLFAKVHSGGLSTTEGIAYELRDAQESEDSSVTISTDKRLCVIEEEFANIFTKCRSGESNLSQTIRTLFDGGDIAPLTKFNRVTCTNPHVCIHGHITPAEFLQSANKGHKENGFTNRFLIIFKVPKPVIPFPKDLDEEKLAPCAKQLAEAMDWCNTDERSIQLSEDSLSIWEKEVLRVSAFGEIESTEANLMYRAPHYLAILACLFSALDRSHVIEKKHILAASAWVDFWHQSITYIFDTEEENLRNQSRKEHASIVMDSILAVAKKLKTNSFKRTELTKTIGRKLTSKETNLALKDLQERPKPPIHVERTGSRNCQIITLL